MADPTEPNPSNPEPISPEERERPRGASVQLRTEADAQQSAVTMDPANQSLADALKITFRLLQLGMVVLVGLFALSGFQTIREGQQGIRLLFGKAESGTLEPGFRFSFPYPLGELVKVQTGTVRLVENRAFWPEGGDGQPAGSVDELPSRRQLRPAADGSVLTADGGIAHTQWSIQYRRSDPRDFAESMLPGDEDQIVLAAVQRGVVQAVATTTIDDLLKQGASGGEALASRARAIAQETLVTARSGITIENLSLDIKTPPKWLKNRFDSVQAAASQAAQTELEAETTKAQILNGVAGSGAQPLIDAIERYERALEVDGDAEAALADVDALLEGQSIVVDGETIEARVSGEVARIIAGARRERSAIVSRAEAELATFRAQKAKYDANAALTVRQVAYDGLRAFLDQPFVQTFSVPVGADTLRLRLNPDPDIRKEQIKQRQLLENLAAEQQREQDRINSEFNIEQGVPAPDQ